MKCLVLGWGLMMCQLYCYASVTTTSITELPKPVYGMCAMEENKILTLASTGRGVENSDDPNYEMPTPGLYIIDVDQSSRTEVLQFDKSIFPTEIEAVALESNRVYVKGLDGFIYETNLLDKVTRALTIKDTNSSITACAVNKNKMILGTVDGLIALVDLNKLFEDASGEPYRSNGIGEQVESVTFVDDELIMTASRSGLAYYRCTGNSLMKIEPETRWDDFCSSGSNIQRPVKLVRNNSSQSIGFLKDVNFVFLCYPHAKLICTLRADFTDWISSIAIEGSTVVLGGVNGQLCVLSGLLSPQTFAVTSSDIVEISPLSEKVFVVATNLGQIIKVFNY